MSNIFDTFMVNYVKNRGTKMDFAEISKTLRKERNLSQAQLADFLKVSKSCISMIEIGRNEPTANTLIRYADFFECSTDYLLGREDDFGNVVIKESSSANLTVEEKSLCKNFRALSNERKMQVLEYAELLLSKQK
ncbi:MAG: helix-turn-helix domain-containing protein [Clostridiales bacterium]|nr:helix-turn-helix domain-containing protein [Clostridiales bacterium]